jgi:signal transduction histidine kinase
MRRIRLSALLIGVNVALLLFAVSGVAFVAVHLLQQFADEQALARVAQAGASAQSAVDRSSGDMLTAAQVLASRPTVTSALDSGAAGSLSAYLSQYQQSSHLAGCAVIARGRVIAHGGADLPWASIWNAGQQGDGRFLDQPSPGGPMLLGAWASVPTDPGAEVVAAETLDASFARQVGNQIELPVAILDRSAAQATPPGPHAALRLHVLATGETATGRLDAPAEYVAVVPLRTPAGQVAGLIETTLPATDVATSLRQLVQTLLLLALGMAAFSAFMSFLIGRRIAVPLQSLTTSAARIGAGDLSTPVPPAGGAEIRTLAATLEDMRERLLRLTGQLRKQQAEAEAIVHGIVEGVFTVDRERRIRYLNPQAAALLGISPEAAIGRFCGDVLKPRGADGARPCADHCPILHARFRGGVRATEHLELPDGRRRTVVITSAAPDEEQQVQVMRDESEVEATRRMRDTVLANISHEFKTPLAAQLASIELLLDRLPTLSVDETGQLVVALQRGTLRLTQLIDNLLESVRIEAGQDSIRRRAVALDEVVEEAVDLTRPLIALRGQGVDVELPYPLPAICGDAPRLTQVFVNLLANANKFAPPDSVIRVGGSVATESVTLWVEDEGPGLPSASEALFERFLRSPSEEPEQSGMGLGLWIVKSIVERHGGRVAVQSGASSGARMCVTLPLAEVMS